MARNPNPTTRLYQIKPGKSGWARIWITDDGCITILSDWGNYGYWFGAPDMEFRAFLLQCDTDYLGNKFSGGRTEFDGEQTVENVKDHILRLRRDQRLSAREARDEWQDLPGTAFDSSDDFTHWLHKTKLPEAWEFSSYCVPMRVQGFLKKVWPLFVEMMRHELASEEAA